LQTNKKFLSTTTTLAAANRQNAARAVVIRRRFAYFISKIDDAEARKFVESCAADIATIYDQSELNNLRILQQTIWDFERFYKAVLAEYRQNNDAMATVMRLLFALSFELKAGRVGEQDLLKGRGISAAVIARMRDKKEEGPKPPMRVAEARYSVVDIDDTFCLTSYSSIFLFEGWSTPTPSTKNCAQAASL
jgi:sigma54-dependent transcription regulator